MKVSIELSAAEEAALTRIAATAGLAAEEYLVARMREVVSSFVKQVDDEDWRDAAEAARGGNFTKLDELRPRFEQTRVISLGGKIGK